MGSLWTRTTSLDLFISRPKQSAWHLAGAKKMCLESRGKHLQFGILQGLTRARLAALLAMNIWSQIVSPLLFQFVNFPFDWTKLSKFA